MNRCTFYPLNYNFIGITYIKKIATPLLDRFECFLKHLLKGKTHLEENKVLDSKCDMFVRRDIFIHLPFYMAKLIVSLYTYS